MKNQLVKDLAIWMSKRENYKFVCDAPNDAEKQRRIQKLKSDFERQSNFANFAFSEVEDIGREDFLNDFSQERAETALIQIRRLLIQEDLKESLTGFIDAKNATAKRNRERRAAIQKGFQKNY